MTDLVERLRKTGGLGEYYTAPQIQIEAADRIEKLEAALKHYSCDCTASAQCPPCMLQDGDCGYVARISLEEKKDD